MFLFLKSCLLLSHGFLILSSLSRNTSTKRTSEYRCASQMLDVRFLNVFGHEYQSSSLSSLLGTSPMDRIKVHLLKRTFVMTELPSCCQRLDDNQHYVCGLNESRKNEQASKIVIMNYNSLFSPSYCVCTSITSSHKLSFIVDRNQLVA